MSSNVNLMVECNSNYLNFSDYDGIDGNSKNKPLKFVVIDRKKHQSFLYGLSIHLDFILDVKHFEIRPDVVL